MAKKPSVIDSARLFALGAVARAEYTYCRVRRRVWIPSSGSRSPPSSATAISTAMRLPNAMPLGSRSARRRRIRNTHVHIASPALASPAWCRQSWVQAEIPEVSMESPTLPGVVHRWTDVRSLHRRVLASTYSGRASLPLFGEGGQHGLQNRRVCGEEHYAARYRLGGCSLIDRHPGPRGAGSANVWANGTRRQECSSSATKNLLQR